MGVLAVVGLAEAVDRQLRAREICRLRTRPRPAGRARRRRAQRRPRRCRSDPRERASGGRDGAPPRGPRAPGKRRNLPQIPELSSWSKIKWRADGNRMAHSAIVTGGTGGLGSAVVERLLDDGWRVVVPVDRRARARAGPGARRARTRPGGPVRSGGGRHPWSPPPRAPPRPRCAASSTSSVASPPAAACTKPRSTNSRSSSG